MAEIKFEEGYLFRNNRAITSSPDIALTELVANAWDAGALKVDITLPFEDRKQISIKDNGCGMTEEEFDERWMTLNYNRTKHQGKYVTFPETLASENRKRIAYGRNGVGRHGMFCFSDKYTVMTYKNGSCFECTIEMSSGEEPFKIINRKNYSKDGHGTEIHAYAHRNIPNIMTIKEIIAARFIYDPQFEVSINGELLSLTTCDGIVEQKNLETINGKKLCVSIIDSTKGAISSQQHGVAFWVCGRLVGNPSWSYGRYQFMDARYRVAKRYTIIVKSDDIIDEVLPD